MRYLTPVLFAAAASVLSTAPAQADLGDQLFKLLAEDGAASDRFGYSVAIRGNTPIVGAAFDSDNGPQSGSAYLFDVSDPKNPVQTAKLLPNDGAMIDHFGLSVAISGNTAVVGAPGDDDNGDGAGSAYLFDATTGQQLFKLLADDGTKTDHFGESVAINDTTALVGACGGAGDNDNAAQSGSAYLFDTTTGRQLFELLPNDSPSGGFFGFSVAISGNTAIIGNFGDDDKSPNAGSAYIFDISDPVNPVQTAKLFPNDGATEDHFGRSVAISDTIAIVGAWQDDDNGPQSGSAYLFDATTGQQLFKLLADDGAVGDRFGVSVAINGAIAIVGAYRDDDNGDDAGSAYLFDTTTGGQVFKVLADDGAVGDQFGRRVAIDGATAISGARLDDDNGVGSGSAYLFDADGTSTCPWDLHGDGVVGAGDLLILLGWWGFDPNGPPDFDGNGNVGASDLLTLLVNWGPCP